MSDRRNLIRDRLQADTEAAGDMVSDMLGAPKVRRPSSRPATKGAAVRVYGAHGQTAGGLVKRTVCFHPEEWAAAVAHAERSGVGSASAVVRMALRAYLRLD